MSQQAIFLLVFKVFFAWIVMSSLVLFFGELLIKGLFPAFKLVIIFITPELSPSLKIVNSVQSHFDELIELSAWVINPIYLNAKKFIPPGGELTSSVHLLHALVPLSIQGGILLAWPVKGWTQRFLLIFLGLVTAVVVILATLPIQLLGMLEMSFQQVAVTGSNPRLVPWFVGWMTFCEMGGRWLLGIVAAWCCIQIKNKVFRPK
jgi:hypothetical protein